MLTERSHVAVVRACTGPPRRASECSYGNHSSRPAKSTIPHLGCQRSPLRKSREIKVFLPDDVRLQRLGEVERFSLWGGAASVCVSRTRAQARNAKQTVFTLRERLQNPGVFEVLQEQHGCLLRRDGTAVDGH